MVSESSINHAHDAALHEAPAKPSTEPGEEDYVDIGYGEWKVFFFLRNL